jgi:hypothetical protein
MRTLKAEAALEGYCRRNFLFVYPRISDEADDFASILDRRMGFFFPGMVAND